MNSPLFRSLFQSQSKENWFDAGLKLGIDQDTLESIRKSHHSDEERFFAMLNQLPKDPHPPTMRDVRKALNKLPVGKPPAVEQTHAGLRAILYRPPCPFGRLHSPPQAARVTHHPAIEIPVYTDLTVVERQQLIVSLQEQTLAIRKEFTELVTATCSGGVQETPYIPRSPE